MTGHSLGGGLSTIVGQKLNLTSVSFSGPGTLVTAHKLKVRSACPYEERVHTIAGRETVCRPTFTSQILERGS